MNRKSIWAFVNSNHFHYGIVIFSFLSFALILSSMPPTKHLFLYENYGGRIENEYYLLYLYLFMFILSFIITLMHQVGYEIVFP